MGKGRFPHPGLRDSTALPMPRLRVSSLQNCETGHFCCLSHPACGSLLQQSLQHPTTELVGRLYLSVELVVLPVKLRGACGPPEMATSTSAVSSLSLRTPATGPALGSDRQTAAALGTGDSEHGLFPPPSPLNLIPQSLPDIKN